MAELVRDLGQEELGELRPLRSGRLRRVGRVLDDRAELACEILIASLDQLPLDHDGPRGRERSGCCTVDARQEDRIRTLV
jgi:hypothetical protein